MRPLVEKPGNACGAPAAGMTFLGEKARPLCAEHLEPEIAAGKDFAMVGDPKRLVLTCFASSKSAPAQPAPAPVVPEPPAAAPPPPPRRGFRR